jgi:hypothetical protein
MKFLRAGQAALAFAIAATTQASANEPKPDDLGILFVGGFQTTRVNYELYLQRFAETHSHVEFQGISQSMLNPDHEKDHQAVQAALAQLIEGGASRIVALGFSSGGKHAARLALENSAVVAIGLLDPVDGGPDPDGKTPLFLKNGVRIQKPTMLLSSEFGPVPKIGNKSCAPKDVGPDHFRKHIAREHLLVDHTVKGSSHLNFVAKPWNFMFSVACNNGTSDHDDALAEVVGQVGAFLATID